MSGFDQNDSQSYLKCLEGAAFLYGCSACIDFKIS